ncbi:UNVERIFIED_CONTAM: hypothetical protein FKN15_040780 [Acipenser sinensis]
MEEPMSCAAVIQESSKGTRRREEAEGLALWKKKLAREPRTEIHTRLAPVEVNYHAQGHRVEARPREPYSPGSRVIQKQRNWAFLECEKVEQRQIGSRILTSAKLDQGESLWMPPKSQMTKGQSEGVCYCAGGTNDGGGAQCKGGLAGWPYAGNRRRCEEELEQPGRTAASGTRAIRVEYQSGDKPANEKGCEEESQRTRTLKWSAAIKEEKERHS